MRSLYAATAKRVVVNMIGGERFKHDDPKLNKCVSAVSWFFANASHESIGIPIPKIALQIFPFLNKWIDYPQELFLPVKEFIQVLLNLIRIILMFIRTICERFIFEGVMIV